VGPVPSFFNHRDFQGPMGRNETTQKTFPEILSSNGLLIFFLFLAILGTYYESLFTPFINIDDPFYIEHNPYIRDLSWRGIYEIFSNIIVTNYFPLQILSYAVDFRIWQLQPFGYHLHNLLLHILNAVLIFLLLKKIFSQPWVSFLAALLFALHPVNVESVTWVAERKNVLSMAFMLLSLGAYLYYLEEQKPIRRWTFYAAALLLFLLALLAKVSAVVLPPLFLLYDLCFLRRKWRGMIRDKLPFFGMALLFSLITVWVYHSGKQLAEYHGGSPYTNFLTMMNVVVEYIHSLILPVSLDFYYYTPISQSFFESQVLLSLGALFLFAFLAWRSWRRNRVFFFWLAWFFISLLPVLNIIPIPILRADRYMYLPAVGLFYLLSLGLWKMGERVNPGYRFPILLLAGVLIAGSYGFLTVERNKLWKDYMNLWEENLRKFPHGQLAYQYLGYGYMQRGKPDQAISYFQAGLRENPKAVILMNGMALAHRSKGDLVKAEEILLRAKQVNPKDSAVLNNLGLIYLKYGDLPKAQSYIQKAVEADPQNYAAQTNLGMLFYSLNQPERAVRELEKAIEMAPGYIEPYLNLAHILWEKRNPEKAKAVLGRSLKMVPNSPKGLVMLGKISYEEGNIQEAREYLYEAYRVNPRDETALHLLRQIDNQGRKDRGSRKEEDRNSLPAGAGEFPAPPGGFLTR
jgi:protein O-mannosyl-transferase